MTFLPLESIRKKTNLRFGRQENASEVKETIEIQNKHDLAHLMLTRNQIAVVVLGLFADRVPFKRGKECRFAVTKEKSERMLLCRDRGEWMRIDGRVRISWEE